jgi:hypothetical protein
MKYTQFYYPYATPLFLTDGTLDLDSSAEVLGRLARLYYKKITKIWTQQKRINVPATPEDFIKHVLFAWLRHMQTEADHYTDPGAPEDYTVLRDAVEIMATVGAIAEDESLEVHGISWDDPLIYFSAPAVGLFREFALGEVYLASATSLHLAVEDVAEQKLLAVFQVTPLRWEDTTVKLLVYHRGFSRKFPILMQRPVIEAMNAWGEMATATLEQNGYTVIRP